MHYIIGIILISIVLAITCFVPIVYELVHRKFDPFEPKNIFVAYLFVQTGGYALYVCLGGSGFRFLDPVAPADRAWILRALWATLAGVLAFYAGYYFGPTRRISELFPVLRSFSKQRVGAAVTLSLPIVGYAIYAAFFADNGFSGYLNDFVQIRYGAIETRGYIIYIATSFCALIAILVLLVSPQDKDSKWRKIGYTLYLISISTTILTGFRAALVPVLLMGAGWYHYALRRLSVTRVIVAVGATTAMLAVYGYGRSIVESRLSGGAPGAQSSSIVDSLAARSPGVEIIGITMRGVSEGERYQLFYPALYEAITIVIPRSLWAGKPVPQSIVFGERFMDYYLYLRDGGLSENTGGYSMTTIGYLYWQAGFIGVVIGMAMFGWLLRLFRAWLLHRRMPHGAIFVSLVLTAFLARFAEAPQDAVNSVVITGGFVALLLWLCSERAGVGPVPDLMQRRVGRSRRAGRISQRFS